jgi:hypothetical protein
MFDNTIWQRFPGCIFAEKVVLETRNEVTQFRGAEKEKKDREKRRRGEGEK